MARPSGSVARRRQAGSTLRVELQRQIERGQCAYCRAPALPDKPLTREHVIPRARGGRRKDFRIIVPACEACNQHRGCKELIPFLLGRPQRISSFLDYLSNLTQESVRELDLRIFAELYAAIAILRECSAHGQRWTDQLERLCSGRSLHRRRYAARRAVGAVSDKLLSLRGGEGEHAGPSCLLPVLGTDPLPLPLPLEEPLERLAARILSILALLWHVPAETVEREMARELNGVMAGPGGLFDGWEDGDPCGGPDGTIVIDGWKARPKRKRLRVDRRTGGSSRQQRYAGSSRGRAA